MNALKNILFFGLLIAVLCGVYLSLSRQPEQPLPPELARQATPPTISGPPALDVPNAPAAGGTASVAPLQPPTMKEWPSSRGDTAPPFPAAPSVTGPPPPVQSGRVDSPDATATLPPPPGDSRCPAATRFIIRNIRPAWPIRRRALRRGAAAWRPRRVRRLLRRRGRNNRIALPWAAPSASLAQCKRSTPTQRASTRYCSKSD